MTNKSFAFRSWQQKEKIYTAMVDAIGCGPFDGGCVAFAMALERVYGGQVYVICGDCAFNPHSPIECSGPQHAVLRLPNGKFMDAETLGSEEEMIEAFNQKECYGRLRHAGLRPLEDDDLDEAPRDAALIDVLADLLGPANKKSLQHNKM